MARPVPAAAATDPSTVRRTTDATPPGHAEAVGIPSLLGPGPFRRLLLGQAVSSLGDWVGTLAFIARAFELTGSPAAVGGVLVLRLLPPALAAPLGGVLADRFDRRRVMVLTNLALGAFTLLAPFVPLGALYAIAFASECLALMFLPARDAAVPDLVGRAALARANALILSSSHAALPIAAALFSGLRLAAGAVPAWVPLAGLLHRSPLSVPFAFDALTFLVAAAMVPPVPPGTGAPRGRVRPLDDLREAVRRSRRIPGVLRLGAGVGFSMFGGGVLFALGISYVHDTLGAGDAEFGFLTALWGLGMAPGVGVVQRVPPADERRVFPAAVAIPGGILVLMGLAPMAGLAYPAAVVFGGSFAVALVLAMSIVQRLAEPAVRGRLVAGAHMLLRGGLALGAVGVGGLVSLIPADVLAPRLDPNRLGLVLGGAVILAGALVSRDRSPASRTRSGARGSAPAVQGAVGPGMGGAGTAPGTSAAPPPEA